jgi:uncharacterized protein with PIN domain
VTGPRWLVDEMLGRLARYLRFLGHDTEWVRGEADDTIRHRALEEGRVLLTRDRQLAARTEGALLIRSPQIREQLREVFLRFPALPSAVTFDRCTLCNGLLEPAPLASINSTAIGPGRRALSDPLFRCTQCRHEFWEGTHTARIRREVEEIIRGSSGS